MENKKTKLTLSGIAKKSIENIELAKTQSKNSVVIEKIGKIEGIQNTETFVELQKTDKEPVYLNNST